MDAQKKRIDEEQEEVEEDDADDADVVLVDEDKKASTSKHIVI